MAEVILAKTAGFCFGVDRAIKLIEKLLSEGRSVATLGPIIHNAQVTDDLASRGVVTVNDPEEVEKGTVLVLRTHGVTRDIKEKADRLGVEYIDAACPFVKKIHKTVLENSGEETVTVISGDPDHPEVRGIKSYAAGEAFVVRNESELTELFEKRPELAQKCVIFVSQTTFSIKEWEKSIKKAKTLCTNAKIFDTICCATEERQKEAAGLSLECDCMVIVGGRHSSNTRKLLGVCEKNCPSFLVETADELNARSFSGFGRIGITAGASTPAGIIKEVLETMSEIENDITMIEEEKVQDSVSAAENFDFEAALEESLSSLNNDQKVEGIVLGVTPTEIQVDIGRKQTGYIPYDEYSNDPAADPKSELKPGDKLNLIIMKTNDQEGTIMLSKKRCDAMKSWDDIIEADGTDKVFEGGVVTEVVPSGKGIIVLWNNIRVFIPASQATARRGDSLEELVKKQVNFKIIDVNKQRRRAVGSIRAVAKEQREAAKNAFWANPPQAGDVVKGNVVSLVDFGAFVDIGGVQGLVHISDLAWKRIKHPSEVLNVGEEIEVNVKKVDLEKQKISLGYRKDEDNPYVVFAKNYEIGSVCDVKITNLTEFGAFAEIIPGIEGLIHISQIANKRIEKPADVLEKGQTVQAKIINIQTEPKFKVSLSIRELLPKEKAEKEEAAPAEEADA